VTSKYPKSPDLSIENWDGTGSPVGEFFEVFRGVDIHEKTFFGIEGNAFFPWNFQHLLFLEKLSDFKVIGVNEPPDGLQEIARIDGVEGLEAIGGAGDNDVMFPRFLRHEPDESGV